MRGTQWASRWVRALGAGALMLCLATCAAGSGRHAAEPTQAGTHETTGSGQPSQLVILHSNDTHGYLVPCG
jgi:hypothetical protein